MVDGFSSEWVDGLHRNLQPDSSKEYAENIEYEEMVERAESENIDA
jgi:hypothetical protein